MVLITLALIAILSAGCSDSHRTSPTAPTGSNTASTAFVPIGVPPFPPVSKPARVYVTAIEGTSAAYHGGALNARYALHDDRSFALQYASPRFGNFEYRGTYSEANGEVVFHWEGWSAAGPWGATATITEELLTVSYNFIMQMTDFEDAVFARVR